jgi:uncharacterized phiE125 gp8 family phage protein
MMFHSLLSMAEAKSLLGTDDREDSLVDFLLAASTYAIEEYCMRRLLRKRVKEWFVNSSETVFTLREYPVAEVSAVGVADGRGGIEPVLYGLLPEAGVCENYPFTLRLLSTPSRARSVFVKYIAGYSMAGVPPDLKEACFELTAWKLQRHNMRFAGIADNKGAAAFESKMPERVKELLEPYRRRTL